MSRLGRSQPQQPTVLATAADAAPAATPAVYVFTPPSAAPLTRGRAMLAKPAPNPPLRADVTDTITDVTTATAASSTPASALLDDFSSADTTKWSYPQTGISVSGGLLNLIPDANYDSIFTQRGDFTLVGDHAVAQMVSPPAQGNGTTEFGWGLLDDATFTKNVRFFWSGGSLFAEYNPGTGTVQIFIATFDPAQHAWQRLRETAGTVYWETSGNGATWTVQYSVADPFTLTGLHGFVVSGFYGTEPTPGTAQLDNWNIPPLLADVSDTTAAVTTATAAATPPPGQRQPIVVADLSRARYGTPHPSLLAGPAHQPPLVFADVTDTITDVTTATATRSDSATVTDTIIDVTMATATRSDSANVTDTIIDVTTATASVSSPFQTRPIVVADLSRARYGTPHPTTLTSASRLPPQVVADVSAAITTVATATAARTDHADVAASTTASTTAAAGRTDHANVTATTYALGDTFEDQFLEGFGSGGVTAERVDQAAVVDAATVLTTTVAARADRANVAASTIASTTAAAGRADHADVAASTAATTSTATSRADSADVAATVTASTTATPTRADHANVSTSTTASTTASATVGHVLDLDVATTVHTRATAHTTGPQRGGWWSLEVILASPRQHRHLLECPHDGEPYTAGPHGELHCAYDGYLPAGEQLHEPTHTAPAGGWESALALVHEPLPQREELPDALDRADGALSPDWRSALALKERTPSPAPVHAPDDPPGW